jgi:predicted MFS family arabinose efflux permease
VNLRRLQIACIYLAGLLQGTAMVSFPASSSVLKDMKGITDAQYGSIFLPLVVTTILGSLAGGALSRRVRLKWLLLTGLLFIGLSQAMLALVEVMVQPAAMRMLLAATATFGLGFGFAAGPLNAYPALLFPGRKDAALLAIHTVIGAGLSLGPFLVGWFIAHAEWVYLPCMLAGLTTLLACTVAALPLILNWPAAADDATPDGTASPLREGVLWACILLAVLYAFAEGTFASWAVIYLKEDRGVSPSTAAFALSLFWAMLAIGRLLVSALLLRVRATHVWLALPATMALAFLLVPSAQTAATGLAVFAFAGLACSAFFPLTVGLVSTRFPSSRALVSSLMTAGLMVGVGAGSFIIGPLRSIVSLENLYRLSALYPIAAFAIALALLRSRRLLPAT